MPASESQSLGIRPRAHAALMRLAREHSSTPRLSAAVAAGAFVGSTPLFGLHTLIGVAASRLLRLNTLAVVLGTQVSLPFLAPLLIFASLQCGMFLLTGGFLSASPDGSIRELAQQYLSAWAVGSLVVGSAVAALSYSVVYLALHLSRKDDEGVDSWDGASRGSALGYRLFHLVARNTSPWVARFMARWVAAYYFVFSPSARRSSAEFFNRVLGDCSRWTSWGHVFRQMRSFSLSLVDRLYFVSGQTSHYSFERDGWDLLEEARAENKGVLLLSAHFGAWSLGGNIMRGGLVPTLVVWAHEADRLRAFFARNQHVAPKIIAMNSGPTAAIEILASLRKGEVVCLLADRVSPDSPHLNCSFLGDKAAFPSGPFRLAAISGAPLLASFNHKISTNEVQLVLRRGPDLTEFKGDEATQMAAEWYVHELEAAVRDHPHQWFNFYDFWRETAQT